MTADLLCSEDSACPFQRIDKFLLSGKKLRAVNLRKRFSFLNISACIVHIKLFNPSFNFGIDSGKSSFVVFNSSNCPDDFMKRFYRNFNSFYGQSTAVFQEVSQLSVVPSPAQFLIQPQLVLYQGHFLHVLNLSSCFKDSAAILFLRGSQ